MGQTLSNGVYLPNEGERNCYAGLASNWQILNTAVGNIAEKAPLVHTHGNITNDGKVGTTANQPLITGTGGAVQAGSFGNAANTFCEGNDSRLSDARTPVAHTHTKSDVTDLFNSANTWTNTNTFQQNIIYERTNFFHQAANPNYYLTDTGLEIGTVPNTPHTAYPGFWRDKNNQNLGYVRFVQYDSGIQTLECDIRNTVSNGSLDPEGSLQRAGFQVVNNPASPIGSCNVYADVLPNSDNTYGLGSSTKRWKTLNGINPGALSFPKGGTTENVDYYNIATAIKPTGGTATNFSGAINYYQPTIDGWLSLVVTNCTDLSVWETTIKYGTVTSGSARNRQVMIPVLANHTYEVSIQGTAWYSARLIPCQGNT